ncbi:cytochrome c oxidase accessory protein FixG [Chryseobacterium piscicola]|uniref:Cytochrome c oxidase accessory protein CcoG n=1 Tax=Chryseobacterium piscicola TaxID=551459 RepID=A0A1N7L8T6_9FLAO|nr:cytochrome c oxidase accessory protein CcoG [Chryseobacterium piscicola]PQA97439.1 cytochrome c oxidase accessory protein CcoG [Chryseobacterium piscicola]SIS70181.1 cytochrome c oxidase accessory protein FixG [Chryseobacterium piscicola]
MSIQHGNIKIPGSDGEAYRDSVGTMDDSGKRKWVFPRKPKGKFTNYRDYTSYILLALFFTIPFLKINNNPVLLINLLDRKFFILGQSFYLQDFFILALGAVISVIFVMIFTVVFGRIFCGWLCPQTIFMEMVFRKIEYLIEGDRNKQMKLDKQNWDYEKIKKRVLKWSVFFMISVIIAHFMFLYIVGYENLFRIMKEGPLEHSIHFTSMLSFSLVFYFVFAWLREQVCTLICPYGRLQGVLIDKQTINVYYDTKRGENRAKWRNGENRKAVSKGDCIDCGQCVVVCPTGIDIRNGQQLECINCTACIDACDEVMTKVGLPTGLVRYATETEIETGKKTGITSRMLITTIFLGLLIGFLGYLLNDRGSMEAKFIKPAGSTFFFRDGKIVNNFTYTFLNKTNEKKVVSIQVLYPKNAEVISSSSSKIILKGDEILKGSISISFPEKDVEFSKKNITIAVINDKGEILDTYETTFEGPFKLLL